MDEVQENKSESWRDILSILFIVYLTPVAAIPVWLLSRWSNLTKWCVTAISIISLVLLYYTSYGGFKYAKFQTAYTPVLELQQAIDVYGIQNGKYPTKLDDLKPKYLSDIPSVASLDYLQKEDGKNYELKASVEGKQVVLGPILRAK